MDGFTKTLKFFLEVFMSRRLGEEQDQMDLEFDRAVAQAKERKIEMEKIDNAKAKLAEFESQHPEETEKIESIRALIREKEDWLNKDAWNGLSRLDNGN